MGTTYSVKIIDEPLDTAKVRFNIDNILDSINMDMSTYIDSSSISKFNNSDIGKSYQISKDFYKVVVSSKYFSNLTNGAFDITVNPLVKLWGFSKNSILEKIPTQNEINKVLKSVGMDNLIIEEGRSINKKSNVTIDLSAIAKGYAVDKISEYLKNKNIKNHIVEIGGEVRTSGFNVKGERWKIGIEYPSFKRSMNKTPYSKINPHTVIKISDMSIATSGDYRNYYDFDGRRYSHIISPKTGYPVENNVSSVTVLAKNCATADAFATGLMVLGYDEGIRIVEELVNIEAIFILNNGNNYEIKQSSKVDKFIVVQ